jgi:hypothetical protein
MNTISVAELKEKVKAALVHLLLSVLVASVAAAVVFGVWFPYPYSEVSGGRTLFWLVIWVDICCGPLLTLVLFSTKKSLKELVLDLGIVAIIQFAALIYGVYSVMAARPVYLVFEVDRFQVVSVADVVKEELPLAKKEFQTLSFFGPRIIAAQPLKPSDKDYMHSVQLGAQGVNISARPTCWVPYSDKIEDALERAKPLNELKLKTPKKTDLLNAAVQKTKLAEEDLAYLPMQSRSVSDWVVLFERKTAKVVGFAHVDGF